MPVPSLPAICCPACGSLALRSAVGNIGGGARLLQAGCMADRAPPDRASQRSNAIATCCRTMHAATDPLTCLSPPPLQPFWGLQRALLRGLHLHPAGPALRGRWAQVRHEGGCCGRPPSSAQPAQPKHLHAYLATPHAGTQLSQCVSTRLLPCTCVRWSCLFALCTLPPSCPNFCSFRRWWAAAPRRCPSTSPPRTMCLLRPPAPWRPLR